MFSSEDNTCCVIVSGNPKAVWLDPGEELCNHDPILDLPMNLGDTVTRGCP